MREEGANLKAEQDGSHLKRHLSKQLLKDRCGSVNNSRGNVVQTEGKPRVLTYVRDNKKKKKQCSGTQGIKEEEQAPSAGSWAKDDLDFSPSEQELLAGEMSLRGYKLEWHYCG